MPTVGAGCDVVGSPNEELTALIAGNGKRHVVGLVVDHASNYSYSLGASTLSVVFFWIDVSACE